MEIGIFTVGIFFAEDLIEFLLQCSARHKTNLIRCGKGSSVIRKIGSHLFWIRAKRLHIAWKKAFLDKNSDCEDMFEKSTCRCSENKCSNKLESKIEDLEKELSNLQEQVSQLLLYREKQLVFNEKGINKSVTSSTNIISIPPPPPPLPTMPLLPNKTVIVKVQSQAVYPVNDCNSTSNLIEELSKRPPKLRHVQRSPGGRPLRRPPADDTTDILINALKKRFDAMHSPKCQDCVISPHSPELSSSF